MELYYAKSEYLADGSMAIMAYEKDEEYDYLEPYGDVTVCLAGYGMTPKEGCIYMPTYKMTKSFVNKVIDDIVEEVIGDVRIGYGEGLYVKLKPNWESGVCMTEWL